jgi:hypothetical protein
MEIEKWLETAISGSSIEAPISLGSVALPINRLCAHGPRYMALLVIE